MSLFHPHLHDHTDRELLIVIIRNQQLLLQNQGKIMSALDDLTTAVGGVETAVTAAVSLLGTISSGATDEAALNALTGRLNTASGDLNAAVAAHTGVTAGST